MKFTILPKILAPITSISIFSSLSLQLNTASAANSASAYRQQGLSLRQQQGKLPEAITALQKSVELEPKNLDGRVLLGWTQHLATKRQDATLTLLAAISQNPYFVPAHNALGIVFLVEGNLPAAVLTHTWAAILKPKNEIAYYNLSLAFHQLQIYPLAIACGNYAAILEPTNPHPLVASAIASWDIGDKNTAKQIYAKAINLDPRYRQHAYLNHLTQAAFTQQQIDTTNKIRQELGVKS